MKTSHNLPALIITGASGLIGKHLLEELKDRFRIFAIARRSQAECNAPKHPNIAWIRADISNISSISKAFREIETAGGADYLIHLAAYYDFINEYHPEYQLTNIEGTKNILTFAKALNLKLFVFASSVAACSFPKPNKFVNETSPADGFHIYAKSKRAGEEVVKEFAGHTTSIIFRLGAVYTDWCEYAPLYTFINTWLGNTWRARILAGKGNSAIPYIHIRDVVAFINKILLTYNKLKPGSVLITSTKGSTTHRKLFKLATKYFYGKERKPILMPKFLCALGIYVIDFIKTVLRKESFEKPWMIKYIDKQLNILNDKTSEITNWAPNPRLSIEKRFPFLIERMKSEPLNWQLRNMMILRKTIARIDFNLYTALAEGETSIVDNILLSVTKSKELNSFSHLQNIDQSELKWFIKLIYRLILTSIDSNSKLLIQNYFEVSGISRFQAGYEIEEIIFLLRTINGEILTYLKGLSHLLKFEKEFYFFITLPIEFGIDEVQQQFSSFKIKPDSKVLSATLEPTAEQLSSRKMLEETIWNCLVNRK
jgi:nucleoside-diphosphate-sugar epimerase